MNESADVLRILGRLEKTLEDGQKETARQFASVSHELADQKAAIADLESRMANAETMARLASRTAEEASYEFKDANVSMVRQMSSLQDRLCVQDDVLESQNTSLSGIRETLSEGAVSMVAAAKQANTKLGIYAGIITVAITSLVPLATKLLDYILR